MNNQTLFTYGTLQDENIQKELFGRKLEGKPDFLYEYASGKIELIQNDFSKITYPVIQYSGKQEDKIEGIVYPISEKELKITDIYEGDAYERIRVTLASGIKAWTYIKSSS